MISCLLLTAGESKRFGSPKALADIFQDKAITLLQNKLLKSNIDEIIIVTGAHETLIEPYVLKHSKVRLVHNKDYKLGQTSSFQKGLSIVDVNSQGFMLLPIDCPLIQIKTIDELLSSFQKKASDILIPSYQKKRGHPPIFHSKLKKIILELSVDKGLNNLMDEHQVSILELNDPGIIQTFNTKEELEELLKVI